jgi:hypothetical protein
MASTESMRSVEAFSFLVEKPIFHNKGKSMDAVNQVLERFEQI